MRRASDLTSRLIFGDLDESSFKVFAEGWQAAYRDGSGNVLELSVSGRRFSAKPTFLGARGLSCGPVDPPRAFGELLNLGAPQWNARLKEHLEARYPITVPEIDADQPSVLYIPDGWLRTILIPVAPEQLPRLLEWHLTLMDDPGLAAAMTQNIAAVAPTAAAMAVLVATVANWMSLDANVEAALKPNQPNSRMKQPSCAIGMLCGGIAFGVPSGAYLPMRGPRMIAPASAATPPTACTTPEPAKSTYPAPRLIVSQVLASQPPPQVHAAKIG